ncbi:MAG: hypothetical protein L0Y76_12945 [Ignavibacteria bacterium]|nr:hypothetical protein [Ignavibacteria bacterium]
MEGTSIIIGFDNHVNQKGLNLKVFGSLSGYHNGKLTYEENYKKILFESFIPFKLGEKVTISGFSDNRTFSFYIRESVPGNVLDLLTQRLNIETGTLKPLTGISSTPFLLDTLPVFQIQNYGETYSG